MVRPGHCIEMDNGTFAQVVLVLEMRDAASSLLCAVYPFRFVNGAQLSGGHPEAPSVPWLKRGSLGLVRVADAKRRVHIIKLHGSAARASGDIDEHFLLNSFMFKSFQGPADRAVYLSCPFECGGRLKMPEVIGSAVKCSVCNEEAPWY